MKKILMILMVMLSLVSCEKEITQCNCGAIIDDGIDDGCYWLKISNDCTGHDKKFWFEQFK